MENETVRTRVMLARGDQTPVAARVSHVQNFTICSCTSPKSMQALSLVRMAHAVGERVEFVAIEVSSACTSQ